MIIIMMTVLMVIMMITVLMVIIDIMAIIPIMMMMMTGKQSNKQLRFTERGEEPGGAQEQAHCCRDKGFIVIDIVINIIII